jgi:nucleotide-binding universal stress UspA family protein
LGECGAEEDTVATDGPVVVGIDGSAGSRAALRAAAEEARLRGRPLRAVMAHGYLDQHRPGGVQAFDPRYTEEDARAALDEALAQELGADPGIAVEPVVIADLPARALLAESESASMVVVGARGLGGFRGLLLGSVSMQLVNHASCPVLVVRHRPA